MKRFFSKWTAVGVALVIGTTLPAHLWGQEKFPKETITILFGWGTGGTADLLLRGLADVMQKDLKVPVIVENKPGGGGVLSWGLLQSAKADGYTIGYVSNSVVLETYKTKGKIDYKNFEPILMLNSAPMAITVHVESPWKTIGEFIEYARANPGKVRVGNSGMGAIFHIFALSVEKKAGVKFTHVPFKAGSECGTALLGKHIEATAPNPGDMSASLATGKLRLLATSGDKRDAFFPDVPTFKESGIDLAMEIWRGVAAPKGTPVERISILEKAFMRAMEQPRSQELLKKLMLANNSLPTAEFRKVYYGEAEKAIPILMALEK